MDNVCNLSPAGSPASFSDHPRLVGPGGPTEVDDVTGRASEGDEVGPRPAEIAEDVGVIHEAIDDPHRLAREVLSAYAHPEGPTLVHLRGGFLVHDGGAYRPDPQFQAGPLVRAVKEAVDRHYLRELARERRARGGNEFAAWGDRADRPRAAPRVTRGLIGDVAQALASMVGVEGEAGEPFWIDARCGDPRPVEVLNTANGLLDLGSDRPELGAHTPRFFSTSVLPYDYEPDAPRPGRWLKFLADQWGDDPQSIDSLHEVIGYLLTPDIRHHKMFLMIGPPRSGRSTIKEVITALIGGRNVTACSSASLGNPFGLEPLLGKSVAIMADARTGGDTATMLDRLLRIVGGDPVEVNCKYRPILSNVLMRTRFLLVSNELPDFRDASRAITSRYHVLRTTATVPLERRDPDLLSGLLAELPGILNLAIEGRRRLNERGRFLQPASATDLIEDAEDIASPVAECVKECFVLDPKTVVSKALAFQAWRGWAERNGHKVGNSATFGKNLRAALPGLRTSRPRDGERQVSIYEGIGLRDEANGKA